MSRRAWSGVGSRLVAAAAIPVAVLVFWARYGRHHPDEPFYLWCGWLSWSGEMPYRDFLFTQMPGAAWLYGAAAALFGRSLYAGRTLSVVLSALAVAVAVALAGRVYGRGARARTAFLLASGSYPMFHLAIAKGYAWSALTITLGVALVAFTHVARRRPRPVLAGVVSTIAAWTRASAVLAAPLVAIGCFRAAGRARAALVAVTAGGIALALAIAPAALSAPRAFWFGVWTFHRVSFMKNPDPWSDLATWYWPQLAIGVAVLAVALAARGRRAIVALAGGYRAHLVAVTVIALVGLHCLAGAQAAEYHALVFPLGAVWLGGVWARAERLARPAARLALRSLAVALGLAGALLTQPGTWLLGAEHPEPPPAIVAAIRRHVPAGERLLTLQPELLLETGRRGVRGTEMGFFSAMYDTRALGWTPPGTLTEEEIYEMIARGEVVAFAMHPGVTRRVLDHAARRRSGRRGFFRDLERALRARYELVLSTPRARPGEPPRRPYQLWVLRDRDE